MRVRAVLAGVVLAATLAACGGSSSTPTASSSAASQAPPPATLEIPTAPVPTLEVTPTPEQTAAAPAGGIVYTVKKGDTLWAIAQKYKITVKALQDANPSVKDPTKLRIGQKLKIPVP